MNHEIIVQLKCILISRGEHVLQACIERRNEDRDPQLNSRVGLKCDCRIVCTTASWKAEIGVGEVSGGLPACSHVKSWERTIVMANGEANDRAWLQKLLWDSHNQLQRKDWINVILLRHVPVFILASSVRKE